jgi:hypothetical protein
MKRLLFYSLLAFVLSTACNQFHKGKKGTIDLTNGTGIKTDTSMVDTIRSDSLSIHHGGPDQNLIDSIKKEKTKGKK